MAATSRRGDDAERGRRLAADYQRGLSLEQVGALHGLGREWVRQLITAYDPGLIARVRVERREAVRAARRLPDRVCMVCGTGFETAHRRQSTCRSDDCVWLAKKARYLFDPRSWARNQASVARRTVAAPDRHPPGTVQGARERLDAYERTGLWPAPSRVYVVEGSEVHRRLLRVLGATGVERLLERRQRETSGFVRLDPSRGDVGDADQRRETPL